jgi:hypothetical protein
MGRPLLLQLVALVALVALVSLSLLLSQKNQWKIKNHSEELPVTKQKLFHFFLSLFQTLNPDYRLMSNLVVSIA